ncbi:hypothetical protein J4210_03040 [Candidatus Woesearchaeota archaeon]|nr:hypothetical protein [Candidatus Woesearchaeota archaeon]
MGILYFLRGAKPSKGTTAQKKDPIVGTKADITANKKTLTSWIYDAFEGSGTKEPVAILRDGSTAEYYLLTMVVNIGEIAWNQLLGTPAYGTGRGQKRLEDVNPLKITATAINSRWMERTARTKKLPVPTPQESCSFVGVVLLLPVLQGKKVGWIIKAGYSSSNSPKLFIYHHDYHLYPSLLNLDAQKVAKLLFKGAHGLSHS